VYCLEECIAPPKTRHTKKLVKKINIRKQNKQNIQVAITEFRSVVTYIYANVCAIHMHICIYVYIYIYICKHFSESYIYPHMYMYIYTYIYMYMYVQYMSTITYTFQNSAMREVSGHSYHMSFSFIIPCILGPGEAFSDFYHGGGFKTWTFLISTVDGVFVYCILCTFTNCNTLQNNATHCNTLLHTVTNCSTLQPC